MCGTIKPRRRCVWADPVFDLRHQSDALATGVAHPQDATAADMGDAYIANPLQIHSRWVIGPR